MSYNVNTTYIYFDALDYSNTSTLSTYTLDITPLRFVPNLATSDLLSAGYITSNKTLRWDFGDGTFSTDLTATHTYSWPGKYTVKLTVYDQNGNAYDSSYSPTIQIVDFIPTQIEFRNPSPDIIANKFIGPIYVDIRDSWQSYPALSSTGHTVNFYASGAGGLTVGTESIANDKWLHLRTLNQFLTVETLNNVKQFVPVTALTAIPTEIYARISDSKIQSCKSTDVGSVFAGISGYCEIYYTDDSLKDIITASPTYLFATLDSSKFHDAFTQKTKLFNYIEYPPYGFQNIEPAVLTINKTNFNPASQLAITTTGIAGEGTYTSNVFDIPAISWQQTEIPYVVTFKDLSGYTTKFYPPLSSSTANSNVTGLTSFDVQTGIVQLIPVYQAISGIPGETFSTSQLLSSLYPGGIFIGSLLPVSAYTDIIAFSAYAENYFALTNYNVPIPGITFYENFPTEAPQSLGSFYRGYFVSQNSMENCQLTASVVIEDPVYHNVYTLSGSSNTFNIYSTGGQFNISKVNENWDASRFYKGLRFQENLIDKNIFFTNFLGTIVGDISAYPYELGKTVYEKIANFTSNKSDIDKVNLDALLAFCDELSIQFEQYNYDFPPQLRRLVDMLSIKQKVLWGSHNTYKSEFNTGSQIVTDIGRGINLGSEISILSGTITTGVPIVAYELFSGNYSLVNAVGINGYDLSTTIPLSTYTYDWGWGLITPESLTGSRVSDYYKFYQYINITAPGYYDNIINWTDPYTTLTPNQSAFGDWSVDDGIMQTMISYELTRGLRLFTSAVQIALT